MIKHLNQEKCAGWGVGSFFHSTPYKLGSVNVNRSEVVK